MNKCEKEQFIRELIGDVQRKILADLDRMPEEWDGFELRQLIADRFVWNSYNLSPRRKRVYKNAKIARNL